MTSILPGQFTPPDYTDGKPFWKWIFIQGYGIWNILMLIFSIVSFYKDSFWIGIVLLVVDLLGLVFEYRTYKQMQKGISK